VVDCVEGLGHRAASALSLALIHKLRGRGILRSSAVHTLQAQPPHKGRTVALAPVCFDHDHMFNFFYLKTRFYNVRMKYELVQT
jgi:hypothetical protein